MPTIILGLGIGRADDIGEGKGRGASAYSVSNCRTCSSAMGWVHRETATRQKTLATSPKIPGWICCHWREGNTSQMSETVQPANNPAKTPAGVERRQ